jgi:Cu2+-exporting ATPase
MSNCYHCGLSVPENTHFKVTIHNQEHAMCCAGCAAVAQAIVDNGLSDYYKHRTKPAQTAQDLVPGFLLHTEAYDNDKVQERFVQFEDENTREAALILEGITCAACVWLNERHIKALPGVLDVSINYTTHRARVKWDNRKIQLSAILQAISAIGYMAHPYDPARQQKILDAERRRHLRRLGLTAALGMQIMMFSVALYVGDWTGGMDLEYRSLFHWICLVLTIPILMYAAEPFYQSAWRDLKRRQAGMDVPISVGLSLAFIGSVWATLSQHGEVYFDSISMFVFFVLSARYFELMARQRSARAAENLVRLVPETAARLTESGEETVLVADLRIGDTLLVRPGEAIAADGAVTQGESGIDESLLTGESKPVKKSPGNEVIAGSINIDSPLQVQVQKLGADTVLSHILRLLERAQSEKPLITQVADRIAGWFVLGVLVLASSVAYYWWQHDPEHWLRVTLAVLVVTCPCALSLATPAAITAATGALARLGFLTTRGHALESLARATHIVFDKTGTLTLGKPSVLDMRVYQGDKASALSVAAALEQHSEHPIATALIDEAIARNAVPAFSVRPGAKPEPRAGNLTNTPGAGIRGDIEGQSWYLGTPDFIQQHTGHIPNDLQALQDDAHTLVILANADGIHAAFMLGDQVRPGAAALISGLKQQGKQLSLLSGDQHSSVEKLARELGIEHYHGQLKPEDKLAQVKAFQAQGAVVAMLGDGVNDAPVLAQAQISIAMGAGTQVARASADIVLLNDDLPILLQALRISKRTLSIIRQNLAWALSYNALALPLAAMGFVTPWMAAIGMSLSSLLVVANALRLTK